MRDAHVQLAVVAFPEALWHEDQWKRIIREDPFAVHRTAEGIVDKAGAIVRLWGLRRLPKIVGVWFSGFAQGELHSPGNLRFTDASNRAMEEAAALRKAIEEHRERQRSNFVSGSVRTPASGTASINSFSPTASATCTAVSLLKERVPC
eukprot:CAMPEP_0117623502 /NCGR_PEP_ID=MMETSP0784-20121206/88680_1 /TAXON_ID=39447 /ORGANISM="" /LENGTH=148 /DNA_ID=CAMNT_0005427455 /DNA_START=184 /DNA_END=630 /DNA_ORIENTATION=-